MPWFRIAKNGLPQLELAVQPGAKSTAFVGMHGGRLKLKVAAPPVEGAANDLLVKFIAKKLGKKKQQVKIVAGEASRYKTVQIDADPAAVLVAANSWADQAKK